MMRCAMCNIPIYDCDDQTIFKFSKNKDRLCSCCTEEILDTSIVGKALSVTSPELYLKLLKDTKKLIHNQ